MFSGVLDWWRWYRLPRDRQFRLRQQREVAGFVVVEMSAADREQLHDQAVLITSDDERPEARRASEWKALRMQCLAVSIRDQSGRCLFDPLNETDLLSLLQLPVSVIDALCNAVAELSALPWLDTKPGK